MLNPTPRLTGESQSENENVQLLCCSFQQYLHCSERIVNSTCGYETARFTKSFLDRMSGPLIQVSYNITGCYTELCKNIPASFQQSPSKCSAAQPIKALWRNISVNRSQNLAGMF